MPEPLRALIYIAFLATCVFWLAKRPLCDGIIDETAYRRDRNLWFAVTVLVFISNNFWIFVVATSLFVLSRSRTHDEPLALYCLLLFAAPPLEKQIPGIGTIEHIVSLNYYRLLNLIILLPLAIRLYRASDSTASKTKAIDFFAASCLIWMSIVHLVSDRPTLSVRSVMYLFCDFWLPYYVGSRALSTLDDFRRTTGALMLSGALVGLIAFFEFVKFWLLYDGVRAAWDIPLELMEPTYLLRDGLLRANASLGNSIAVGYTMLICLSIWMYMQPSLQPKWRSRGIAALLVAGLIGSLSRGPWVGTAAAITAFFTIGRNIGKRIVSMTAVVGVVVLVLAISPLGDIVIPYLPFVGNVETENIDYRSRLLEVSLIVFSQNPIAGDFFFLRNPLMETMRQGQGIIDIVNTYLQVALPFGSIGLVLFLGIFISALRGVARTRKQATENIEAERLARALLAALTGIMITIGTVSSISVIPTLYWLWLGLCASYVRAFSTTDSKVRSRAAIRRKSQNPAPRTASTASPMQPMSTRNLKSARK